MGLKAPLFLELYIKHKFQEGPTITDCNFSVHIIKVLSRPGFDSRPGHVSPGTSSLEWR